jgi:hypothetical protein
MAMMSTIARIARTIRALIHRGDNTQIQGQVMWPVSFRPINRTVRRPVKPIPPDEDEEELDIFFSVYGVIKGEKGVRTLPWKQSTGTYSLNSSEIVNVKERGAVIQRLSQLETLSLQEFCLFVIPFSQKMVNLISHIYETGGNQGLNVHVFGIQGIVGKVVVKLRH